VIVCVSAACGAARLGAAKRQLVDVVWSPRITVGYARFAPKPPAASVMACVVSLPAEQMIWTVTPAHGAPVARRTSPVTLAVPFEIGSVAQPTMMTINHNSFLKAPSEMDVHLPLAMVRTGCTRVHVRRGSSGASSERASYRCHRVWDCRTTACGTSL